MEYHTNTLDHAICLNLDPFLLVQHAEQAISFFPQ